MEIIIRNNIMESLKIYEKIDRLRKDKGWSLNYLSTQAGISHSTMHSWKARQTMPSVDVLEGLCDALQISLPQLFSDDGYSEEMPEENKRLLEYWSTLNRSEKELIMNTIIAIRSKK